MDRSTEALAPPKSDCIVLTFFFCLLFATFCAASVRWIFPSGAARALHRKIMAVITTNNGRQPLDLPGKSEDVLNRCPTVPRSRGEVAGAARFPGAARLLHPGPAWSKYRERNSRERLDVTTRSSLS